MNYECVYPSSYPDFTKQKLIWEKQCDYIYLSTYYVMPHTFLKSKDWAQAVLKNKSVIL